MTTETKELQAKEKQELASAAEQTKPGLVFTPDVDIYETEHALKLLADMPGVAPETLSIDLRDNVLTITGDSPKLDNTDEKAVLVEYNTGTYYRQFTLSEVINQEKIDAQLNDGVLSLTLPKIEKAAPRKITVTVQ